MGAPPIAQVQLMGQIGTHIFFMTLSNTFIPHSTPNLNSQMNVDFSHRKTNRVTMRDIPRYDDFGLVSLFILLH